MGDETGMVVSKANEDDEEFSKPMMYLFDEIELRERKRE